MPLNIDFVQILLHLLNFVILAGGLTLLLFNPVKKFIETHNGQVMVISSIIVYSVALFAVCILLDFLREKLFSFIGRILRLEDIYERICDWYWWSTRL